MRYEVKFRYRPLGDRAGEAEGSVQVEAPSKMTASFTAGYAAARALGVNLSAVDAVTVNPVRERQTAT